MFEVHKTYLLSVINHGVVLLAAFCLLCLEPLFPNHASFRIMCCNKVGNDVIFTSIFVFNVPHKSMDVYACLSVKCLDDTVYRIVIFMHSVVRFPLFNLRMINASSKLLLRFHIRFFLYDSLSCNDHT